MSTGLKMFDEWENTRVFDPTLFQLACPGQAPEKLSEHSKVALANFVYTGVLRPLDAESALELMPYSYLLKVKCLEWFSRSLTPMNVLSRYEKALEEDQQEAVDACRRFLAILCDPFGDGFFNSCPPTQQERIQEILRVDAPIRLRKDPKAISFLLSGQYSPETTQFSSTEDWENADTT